MLTSAINVRRMSRNRSGPRRDKRVPCPLVSRHERILSAVRATFSIAGINGRHGSQARNVSPVWLAKLHISRDGPELAETVPSGAYSDDWLALAPTATVPRHAARR
jgi:hypothetical protein